MCCSIFKPFIQPIDNVLVPRQRVKKGWTKYTNLSVKEKDYIKMRRIFETYYTGDLQWIDWIPIFASGMLSRYKIIKTKYPHLKLISSGDGIIVEDTKNNKLVKIDEKLEAEPEYLLFALLHPEFKV